VVGDLNGDGKADAVGFESAGVEVALANVTGNGGVSDPLQNLAYTYDQAGNVNQTTDALHGETQTYGYDSLDRLTS